MFDHDPFISQTKEYTSIFPQCGCRTRFQTLLKRTPFREQPRRYEIKYLRDDTAKRYWTHLDTHVAQLHSGKVKYRRRNALTSIPC